MRQIQLMIKRCIDFLVSLVLIIILMPVLLLLSLAIVFESKGSPIFKQERIGYKGEVFSIYKFRTMIQNAEKMGNGLFVYDGNDKRITKVGKFLRSTSLDELPQLFNVLSGKMSIVGPRPPVTYHPYKGYECYPERFKKRFEMRPGITGLAQVKLRNSATWDERIEVDLHYVENYSLLLDMTIVFKTFFSMFYKETYTE